MPYFEDYTPYVAELQSGHYSTALDHGLELLMRTKQFAPSQYWATPKGTPFYFLGIAALLSHDYQTGMFLIDAAAAEDLRNNPGQNDLPALLFMQLNVKKPAQFAFQIVQATENQLREAVASYNGRTGCSAITVNDVRQRFFARVLNAGQPHRTTLIASFISYLLEWDYKSALIGLTEPNVGSREPFFLHLFRGCLLFESLLKDNPSKTPPADAALGRLLQHLSKELGIRPDLSIQSEHYSTIIRSLAPKQSIVDAIQCTGTVRNTLAHNIAIQSSLDETNYDLLADNIASSCLHAISRLYP